MSLLLPLPWALHLGATLAMAGVLWVVQVAIYPLFDAVGRHEFTRYHARYMAAVSWVVAPLMLIEAATAAWLWWAGLRGPAFALALLFLAVAWISTFALQVPLHRRLQLAQDPALIHRLVISNWIRTIAWTIRALLLLFATRIGT